MRTKLILTLILLLGLFFFLNWASGRYLASLVTQQLDRLASVDDGVEYRYDKVAVNPAFGSLTVNNLAFHHHGNLIEIKKVTGSLTHADMWRVMRKGSGDPLAQIHSFRIGMEDLNFHDTPSGISGFQREDNDPFQWLFGESVMIGSLHLIYNGRMDELLQIAGSTHPPRQNHRISLKMDDIEFHEEIPEQLKSLPVFSGFFFPEFIEQLTFQIRYNAEQRSAKLSSLRMTTPDLSLRTSGELSYGESGWPDHPEKWNLNYMLHAATHEVARLPLPGKLGGFSMDTLSVSSIVSFDDSQRMRHPFTLPGQTSVYLGDIWWYPSSDLTQQYGLIFGMFGLSDKELPIQSIQARWSNSGDTLRIDDTAVSTDPFDAKINSIVTLPPDLRADILEGSIIFTRTNAAFNDFVDGVEGLFRVELPRKNGQLFFEFSGDPRSPHFKFLDQISDTRMPAPPTDD